MHVRARIVSGAIFGLENYSGSIFGLEENLQVQILVLKKIFKSVFWT